MISNMASDGFSGNLGRLSIISPVGPGLFLDSGSADDLEWEA